MNTAIATVCLTLIVAFAIWLIWPKRKKINMDDLLDKEAIGAPTKYAEGISKLQEAMKDAYTNGQRRQLSIQLLPSVVIAYPDSSYERQVRTSLELADEYIRQSLSI